MEATPSPMKALIAQAVDVVVYLEKTAAVQGKGGRKIQETLQIEGLYRSQYRLTPLETLPE